MIADFMSNYGFAGGIIFLILGMIDYAIIMNVVMPKVEKVRQDRIAAGDTELAAENPTEFIRLVMMIVNFLVFPAVGYWLGPQVLPGLGF